MDTDKVIRFKEIANLLFSQDKKVCIKDIGNNLYFGNIINIQEDYLEIKCFAPSQRAGKTFPIYWLRIFDIDIYQRKDFS